MASGSPQQALLSNASVLDLLFPGLSLITPAIQQLAAGSLTGYTGLLCACGLLLYIGRFIYRYLRGLVSAYFSAYLLPPQLGKC
jgi:chaperone BCS1